MPDQPVTPPAVETLAESPPKDDFAAQADEKPVSLLYEFGEFLMTSAAWWITPIVVVLLLVGGLTMLAASGAAPFIYTLF